MRIAGSLLMLVLLLSPITVTSLTSNGGGGGARILVVCSDVSDVMFANTLGFQGYNVDYLYLGRDLPGNRSLLSDLSYMLGYDEVWIPDLNVEWTSGGRLSESELNTLREYVERGGILVVGFNTYTQSWSPGLEHLTGARIMRLILPPFCPENWSIIYEGLWYRYNCTHQAVQVEPTRGKVVARFNSGEPAITESNYGDGVVVLMTFNPVNALMDEPRLVRVYSNIAKVALDERIHPPKPLSPREEALLKVKGAVRNPWTWVLLFLLFIWAMGMLGFLPYGATLVVAIPFLPLSKLLVKRPLYKRILESVTALKGVEASALAMEVGVGKRRLKFPLAILLLKRKVNLIDLSPAGVHETLIVPWRGEYEGVSAWASRIHSDLVKLVVENPGITVDELAYMLKTPPYDLLKLARWLALYGVVEIREIGDGHEIYPAKPLLRVL